MSDKDIFRPWWGIDAGNLVAELSEPMRDLGYHVAIAGSVAKKGWGRDLDLVIIPTFTTAAPVMVVVGTLVDTYSDWEIISRPHHTPPYVGECIQFVVLTKDDRLIDILIGPEPDPDVRDEAWLEHQIHEEGWGDGC